MRVFVAALMFVWFVLGGLTVPASASDIPAVPQNIAAPPPGTVALCLRNPSLCQHAEAATAPVSMQDEILATNVEVNKRIQSRNLEDNPYKDGADASNWQMLAPGGVGDCKDYTLTKLFLLDWLGVPRGAMRLAVVHVPGSSDKLNHAILIVRIGGTDYVLDNLTDEMRPLASVAYRVLAVQNPTEQVWIAAN